MADLLTRSEAIRSKPIGEGLDAFRESFNSIYKHLEFPISANTLVGIGDEGIQNVALDLVSALQILPASRILRSSTGRGNLFGDLLKLNTSINADGFEIERIIPLLNCVLGNEQDDVIWDKVYAAVTEATPPPRLLSFLDQTPYFYNTSSLANSSEHRKHMDQLLKEELGPLYVGVPGFIEAFFGDVQGLQTASVAVFEKCTEGDNPRYNENIGWRDWPKSANEKDVLKWLVDLVDVFLDFAKEQALAPKAQRRLVTQPHQPLQGSTAERKLDLGFVDSQAATKHSGYHWSQILVPGELKSNPGFDNSSNAWLDLGRYAREVLAAQDSRRFVQGFTLCGANLRLWEYDRVGGIASSAIDINKDGLQFVSAMMGYLWMNEEQLGFDPTILESGGKRYIEITRDNRNERLVIDHLIKRAPCVVGRATTCWLAHQEGDESKRPLVVKDSWQYPEREEEGILLREATEKGVVNVARYYHHETVSVKGKEDDILNNVRKGLDITMATNYSPQRLKMPQRGSSQSGRSTSVSAGRGRKRSSSRSDALLPACKRTCSGSSTKGANSSARKNRVHRRVIVCDYGKAIHKASSLAAMLAALEGCIQGYESLHDKAHMLQRDISIGNLRMNEDSDNPSWPSFLIDLDLAIKEQRAESSGAQGITGTRAFMAIGVLYNEKHSFMHDLESFFWVLFWICIHYNGPGKGERVTEFECWNYEDTAKLAKLKKGTVDDEDDFLATVAVHFTPYYQPLIPLMNRLRRVVFPNGGRWREENRALYSQMMGILKEAQKDLQVFAY